MVISVNDQTKVDIDAARARTRVNVSVVRDYLYGGREKWDIHTKLEGILSREPVFAKDKKDFLGRTGLYTRAVAITNRLFELEELHKWSSQETSEATSILFEVLPITLHTLAFEPVFKSQGSASLLARYQHLIANKGIQGCYLQTELGHGTNVSRLETTATYIAETEEFEIHSPTLTSSKWWIGGLGKTATHGVVQAKLILPGGKDVGPHLFFVQLRSLEDHSVLPGITLGDIGPKALGGMAATDNGFATFNRVRIPRENMLSKFAQVSEDGKYVQPPHSKLSYGGMLFIRSSMVTSAGWTVARAATISVRYTTVRRQGGEDRNGLERQVISYPSTYYRLLPILSHAYLFIQLGRRLTQAFQEMSSRLSTGDTSLLAEMHAITCGLKVLMSSTGVQDLETARRSMGGHGYSAFSGVGRLYADYLPSVTYEGDNFVLDGQVVRAALKSYRSLLSSKEPSASLLSPSTMYLRLLLNGPRGPPLVSSPSWSESAVVITMLEQRAALMVQEYARTIEEPDASVNQRLSKAVTEAFVAAQVGHMIDELKTLPAMERRVISDLYRLYLLTTAEAALVDLFSFGLICRDGASDPTRSLRLAISTLCAELLPDAIGLTDAFGFSDWALDSALGVHDGRVYEALWNRAQAEPLNRDDATPAYEDSIKPMLRRGQMAAGLIPSKL
ncbi:acyl-CoA oxidase [Leucogyrophana mollusca]|uniref:Acyl-CoA oxidase n=1 Tax=Leucogyrophana mollusca TaxID=85980 RepID=A0ACB8BQS2_9AGAM|nr:acyl-CoA oxidase [Leucogyrophana mollusca]